MFNIIFRTSPLSKINDVPSISQHHFRWCNSSSSIFLQMTFICYISNVKAYGNRCFWPLQLQSSEQWRSNGRSNVLCFFIESLCMNYLSPMRITNYYAGENTFLCVVSFQIYTTHIKISRSIHKKLFGLKIRYKVIKCTCLYNKQVYG